MKPNTPLVLLCYDIVNHRTRAKAQKVADAFGERINDSVYECWLAPYDEARLRKKLEKLVNPREDSVYLYRICSACYEKLTVLGLRTQTQPETLRIV